jgi:hypothetical protein
LPLNGALGFMSIIHTIFITFTLLFFSFDSNSNENAPTDKELKAHLFSKSNDFEVLISILNKTEYSSVLWIKDGPLNARAGNNKNAVWNKSPQLDEFVNTAIGFGFGSLLIGVDDYGNWSISTGQEVVFLDGDPSIGTAKVKTIKKSFWLGKQPEVSICTSEIVEKYFEGQCYIPLINNWFLYKYWFTYDPAKEQT